MKKLSDEVSISKIEILDFEEKHADEILRIQAETNLSFWSMTDYLGELKRTDSIFKVAQTADEKVIAFALLRLLIGSFTALNISFDAAEILNIAVCNSCQKQGVGQKMFDEILRELDKKNIKEIWLEVRVSNSQAITFYHKNNFIKQSERKNYYSNPTENALILYRAVNISIK